MKLIVTGATGLLGTEVIRQSLQNNKITQVIALARKPVQVDINSSKLKSVVIRDYGEYPDDVKADLSGADACIWTVAVTPFRQTQFDFAEIRRVCRDCTAEGFNAIYEAGSARPLRFLYVSATGTPRDPAQRPMVWGDYQVMRGETELMVLDFPSKYKDVEVCIAKPGAITNSNSWFRVVIGSMFSVLNLFTRAIPNVHLTEVAAALLNQAVQGFEQETLDNSDLVRIGQAELQSQKASHLS
ncbi:hypothetical protein BO94DRAFT_629345 [Aspergillus sclerotioniger CBS 115572]|uniref:NAD(P)-binding domain-containing protein n=1 Tax=Aspergillus sclerotioniger CBS 115572 TaxID=1450535 RepID=A0A317UTE7_9EURO|nr:hypothetical protein BO94DRAFT_629345 [Aspergillus sclerotioniger CBS 115572]PWY64731.1 hypothetical protein BO94DRAFT_629345 [Aspergillus sclerotioniger CBS 115572]